MVHHVKAALAVGSIVTLLHGMGLLGWLDALMLRLVAGVAPSAWMQHSADPAAPAVPQVLLIGPTLHETHFQQASPLPQAPLAALVQALASGSASAPTTLVIDLDLSPGPLDDPGRPVLDAALQRLVERGTHVVLPLPLRVASPALQERKWRWLQQQCRLGAAPDPAASPAGRGRVLLGLSEVVTTQGVASQFDPVAPTLGLVALPGGEQRSLCPWVLAPGDAWRAPMLSNAFDSRALPVATHGTVLRPFNARQFSATQAQAVVLREPTLSPPQRLRVAGATVFLGGAYHAQDRFVTPFDGTAGRTEGVFLHAATFESARQPVGVVEGLAAWGLDVVLGVALGALFSATWGWHQQRVATAQHFPGMGPQWAARGALLANLLLVAALVLLAMVLAQALFIPFNLWVNPGPVVLGVFAKFVLASRSSGHGHQAHAGALHRVDDALLVLLVLVTLVLLFLHH